MSEANRSAFTPAVSRPGMMKLQRSQDSGFNDFSPTGVNVVSARKTETGFGAQMASQSMAMPGSAPTRNTFSSNLNHNRLLDQPTLPSDFNLKSVKMQETEACQLCEATFTHKLKVMNRVSMKNCKRCGRAICEMCSDQRR